jgi:phosphoglycerate dehydrogenase-like enzyme
LVSAGSDAWRNEGPCDAGDDGMPLIVNQHGPEMERELLAHWSRPDVISPPEWAPRWIWPADVDVLLTTQSGWDGAPEYPVPGFDCLRWVQLDSVGVDRYPHWLLRAPLVANARGANAAPIAEYVMSAILAFEKRFDEARVRRPEEWGHVRMGRLEGRILGLAGFGAVGAAIASRAQAFGMRVAAFRRSRWQREPHDVLPVESIDELAAISDHLVLACPLTRETRNMINARVLSSARRGMQLINVSSGSLIEESALLLALADGTVERAVLDVTTPEPLPRKHPFYTHDRIRLTPHIAAVSPNNSVRMRRIVLDNLSAFVHGEPLSNLVDPDRGY